MYELYQDNYKCDGKEKIKLTMFNRSFITHKILVT